MCRCVVASYSFRIVYVMCLVYAIIHKNILLLEICLHCFGGTSGMCTVPTNKQAMMAGDMNDVNR